MLPIFAPLSKPVVCRYNGDPYFAKTAHLEIDTAVHFLAQAWIRDEKGEQTLVFREWIYQEDIERVNEEIFGPIREANKRPGSCNFSFERHILQFRWKCK